VSAAQAKQGCARAKLAEAVSFYRAGIAGCRRFFDRALASLRLAECLTVLGERDEAIDVLAQLQASAPNFGPSCLILGRLHLSKTPPNAKEALRFLLPYARNHATREDVRKSVERAHRLLADQAVATRRWKEAAKHIQWAIEYGGGDADTYVKLGIARKEMGDLVGAREAFQEAARLAPDRKDVRAGLRALREKREKGAQGEAH